MLGGGDLPAGQIQPLGACRATRSTLSRRGSNAAPRALGGESGGAGAEPPQWSKPVDVCLASQIDNALTIL